MNFRTLFYLSYFWTTLCQLSIRIDSIRIPSCIDCLPYYVQVIDSNHIYVMCLREGEIRCYNYEGVLSYSYRKEGLLPFYIFPWHCGSLGIGSINDLFLLGQDKSLRRIPISEKGWGLLYHMQGRMKGNIVCYDSLLVLPLLFKRDPPFLKKKGEKYRLGWNILSVCSIRGNKLYLKKRFGHWDYYSYYFASHPRVEEGYWFAYWVDTLEVPARVYISPIYSPLIQIYRIEGDLIRCFPMTTEPDRVFTSLHDHHSFVRRHKIKSFVEWLLLNFQYGGIFADEHYLYRVVFPPVDSLFEIGAVEEKPPRRQCGWRSEREMRRCEEYYQRKRPVLLVYHKNSFTEVSSFSLPFYCQFVGFHVREGCAYFFREEGSNLILYRIHIGGLRGYFHESGGSDS